MKNNLRRSALYVPGDSNKMLQRSLETSSDILLLNLEDGVALSRKESARENVVQALKELNFDGHEAVVRVNSLATATGRTDLAAVVPLRPDGICLPKIENAAEIAEAAHAIQELEIGRGIPAGTVMLHAMIESAAGVLHAPEIAAASPRMRSLIFGSADYVNDVRCRPGEERLELLLALQLIVTSARSVGIDAIDAPCFDIRSYDLIRSEAAQARRFGFDGKSAIHPDQCPIINQVFDVTPEEIEWAEKTLAGLSAAENLGKALATLDGKLIDNPHRAAAERILSRMHP
jgi:citrate lyase subunit beta / citryl-CoA lyase